MFRWGHRNGIEKSLGICFGVGIEMELKKSLGICFGEAIEEKNQKNIEERCVGIEREF